MQPDFWTQKEKETRRAACTARIFTALTAATLLLLLCFSLHVFKCGYLDKRGHVNHIYEDALMTLRHCEGFDEHAKIKFADQCGHAWSIAQQGKFWLHVDELQKHVVSDLGADFLVSLYHKSPLGLCLLLAGIGTMTALVWNNGCKQAHAIIMAQTPLEQQQRMAMRKLLGSLATFTLGTQSADGAAKEKQV